MGSGWSASSQPSSLLTPSQSPWELLQGWAGPREPAPAGDQAVFTGKETRISAGTAASPSFPLQPGEAIVHCPFPEGLCAGLLKGRSVGRARCALISCIWKRKSEVCCAVELEPCPPQLMAGTGVFLRPPGHVNWALCLPGRPAVGVGTAGTGTRGAPSPDEQGLQGHGVFNLDPFSVLSLALDFLFLFFNDRVSFNQIKRNVKSRFTF